MRARLRCNALCLGAGGAKKFILSDSGRKRFVRSDERNLVVIEPGPGQGWRVPIRGVLGIGAGVVFGGQLEKTFLGHKVVGAAGQTAASAGLLSEEKGLRHGTTRNKAGVHFGLSVAGAWGSLPAMTEY
jgi:hypothetical protein